MSDEPRRRSYSPGERGGSERGERGDRGDRERGDRDRGDRDRGDRDRGDDRRPRDRSRSRSPPRRYRDRSYSPSPGRRYDRYDRRGPPRDYPPPRYNDRYGPPPPHHRGDYGPPPPHYRGGPPPPGRRGRRDEGPPGVSLLVRNVNSDITPQDLHQAFGRIGEIRDVYIPRDYNTQQPKGFAFIEFASERAAAEARDEMDRFVMKGSELEVVFAQERRKTPNEMRGRVVNRQNARGERSSSFERQQRKDDR